MCLRMPHQNLFQIQDRVQLLRHLRPLCFHYLVDTLSDRSKAEKRHIHSVFSHVSFPSCRCRFDPFRLLPVSCHSSAISSGDQASAVILPYCQAPCKCTGLFILHVLCWRCAPAALLLQERLALFGIFRQPGSFTYGIAGSQAVTPPTYERAGLTACPSLSDICITYYN